MHGFSTGSSGSRGSLSALVTSVACPHCGSAIDGPFYRAPIPLPVCKTHAPRRPHAPRCRVIVVIDPMGERHEVHQVRDGESKEQALERVARNLAA